uniref:LigA n=1 Tax=Parastrongyloides trichosuri TaxID=131310 RepID=A0A0N4ZAM5_PARTI
MGHGSFRPCDGEVNQADRLVVRSAARPGDPGDGHRDLCPRMRLRSLGHGPGRRFRHRPETRQHVLLHAQHLHLGLVAVGDEAPIHDGRRPCDRRQGARHQSAGAAFGRCDHQTGPDRMADHVFSGRLDILRQHGNSLHPRVVLASTCGITRFRSKAAHDRTRPVPGASQDRRDNTCRLRRRHLHLGQSGFPGSADGDQAGAAAAGRIAIGVEHRHGLLPGGAAGGLSLRPPAATDSVDHLDPAGRRAVQPDAGRDRPPFDRRGLGPLPLGRAAGPLSADLRHRLPDPAVDIAARHPDPAGDLHRHDSRPGRHDDGTLADTAGRASGRLLLHDPDVPPAVGRPTPGAGPADRVLPADVVGRRAGRGLHSLAGADPVRDRARISAGHGAGLSGATVAGRTSALLRSAGHRRLLIRRGADPSADARGDRGLSEAAEADGRRGAAPVQPQPGDHPARRRRRARTGRRRTAPDLHRAPRRRPDGRSVDRGPGHLAYARRSGRLQGRRPLAQAGADRGPPLDRRLRQPVRRPGPQHEGACGLGRPRHPRQIGGDPLGDLQAVARRGPVALHHDLLVRPDLPEGVVLLDQTHQAHRIGEGVVAQRQHRALGPDVDLLDAGRPAVGLDADDPQELLRLVRQRAEPVDQFGGHGLAILHLLGVRQTAIQAQARDPGPPRPVPAVRRRRLPAFADTARRRPRGYGPTVRRPAGCPRRAGPDRGWPAGSRRPDCPATAAPAAAARPTGSAAWWGRSSDRRRPAPWNGQRGHAADKAVQDRTYRHDARPGYWPSECRCRSRRWWSRPARHTRRHRRRSSPLPAGSGSSGRGRRRTSPQEPVRAGTARYPADPSAAARRNRPDRRDTSRAAGPRAPARDPTASH